MKKVGMLLSALVCGVVNAQVYVVVDYATDLRIASWDPSGSSSASVNAKEVRGSQLMRNDLFNVCRARVDADGEVWLYGQALEQIDERARPLEGWIKKTSAKLFKNLVVNCSLAHVALREGGKEFLCDASFGSSFQGRRISGGCYEIALPDGRIGYIPAVCVTNLEELDTLSTHATRERVVANAHLFLDSPYLWGGRSFYYPDAARTTSVDCSALTHLLYQERGISIPRNSGAQYALSRHIYAAELKPADLIFLARQESPSKICHVMLYIGDGAFIEASGLAGIVRKLSFKDIGVCEWEALSNGDMVTIAWPSDVTRNYHMYFGSYCTD